MNKKQLHNVQFLMQLLDHNYQIIDESASEDIIEKSNDILELVDDNDSNSNEEVINIRLSNNIDDDDFDFSFDEDDDILDDNEEIINLKLSNMDLNSDFSDIDNYSNETTINVALKNEKVINVKLHDPDLEPTSLSDPNAINVKLVNTDIPDDEESAFIKKRDELLASDNPNFQLSVCIKTLMQLKDSLDKLTNHIPKETTLVKTKYIISDILENIVDDHKLLLKDPEKCKEIIIKIFDLVISLRQYIIQKYNELKSKAENTSKPEETDAISDRIKEVESNAEKEDEDDTEIGIDDLTGEITSMDIDNDNPEDQANRNNEPNINFKKI